MNALNSFLKKEVAVIGANTAFGKMTSFLLKQSPLLSKLTLYDDKNIKPLDDTKYINTPCKVSFVNGREQMSEAIRTADIIIIGDDNLKGMSHEAAFMTRALSFSNNVRQIADINSYAIIVVATSPVNMTVPLAAEVLRNHGKLDERKLIGMSNVESIKARSILAQHLQISPTMIDLPVVGGLTSETCVPLLSNMSPSIPLSKANLQKITCAVKTSGTKLQNSEGSQESLNRAYATAKLIKSIVTGLNGHPTVETVLSYQKIIDGTDFFSLPVLLGENGIINHMTLPNISQREKYLLSHAITCMAAESKQAKNCYHKISNKLVKAPQNKLNKLKTPAIQYNQPQSQYTSIENGTKNTFYPTTSNGTDSCGKKIKANLDHIYASIYSCNENIKKSINHNKNKSFNIKKSHIQYSAKNRKENDGTLIRKDDRSKILNKKENQSEHIQGEIPKSHFISSSCVATGYETQAKHLELGEPLQFKIRNKTGNSTSRLTLDNKKLASESEKTKNDKNGLFEFKSATKNLNTEKEIISTNPMVNFINTIIKSPQIGYKSQNCAVGENKSPVKCNNTAEQTNASETISTDPQQTCPSSENLEKIFTSNIVRMVNETEERKRRANGPLGSIEDQSEHKITNLNNRPKGTNSYLEINTNNNNKHFDLFKMSSTKMDDIRLIINKTEIEPMSTSSFIVSDDFKTSGEKYSLQTNQPHWILHSMLFKSHQSLKRPMLSRYVSSGSSESEFEKKNAGINSVKEVRQIASLSKPLRSANKPQETFLSESVDIGINNKAFINSNCGNIEKQTVTSIAKSQANIKSPREVFLSRCLPSVSDKKQIENGDFNSQNKIKQASSLLKLKTNTSGSQESSRSPDATSEDQEGGMGNKQFNSEEKVRQINPVSTSRKNVNKPDESLAVTFKGDSYDSPLPTSKFSSAKRYEAQRKIYINPMKSSDTSVLENILQKQMDSISSGHKIASFKSDSIENSFSTQQRKATSTEMLDKNAQHRNNPNDFQKLHVLTNNSKVYPMKDKLLDNELKSSGVNESHCNNNYFKEHSNQQISQNSGENIETVPHQCNRSDKKCYSDKEHEQIECKSIGNKSFDASNNQPESVPFKYRQKETMSDDNEPVSEVTHSSINENHLSTPQEHGPGVNSGEHDNNSKYIQQRSVVASEANYTEGIKSEESSLKQLTSKESKKETA